MSRDRRPTRAVAPSAQYDVARYAASSRGGTVTDPRARRRTPRHDAHGPTSARPFRASP
jgi:hypothetical protein